MARLNHACAEGVARIGMHNRRLRSQSAISSDSHGGRPSARVGG
jgi:hypothetical protein